MSAPATRLDGGTGGQYDVTMKLRARRTMTAALFKARCLKVLDDVAKHGDRVLITKRGKPVAELVPLEAPKGKPLRGSVLFFKDPLAPVDVEWEANR